MAGITKIREGNDDNYEAVAVVAGGKLVIAANGSTTPGVQGITVAGDAATTVLGVAARLAEPLANQDLSGTDGDGYPVAYASPVNAYTTVYKECVVNVTYAAAAVAFGVKLCAAATGNVRAWVSGTDPVHSIVGECRVVGGMGSGGGLGQALIY